MTITLSLIALAIIILLAVMVYIAWPKEHEPFDESETEVDE